MTTALSSAPERCGLLCFWAPQREDAIIEVRNQSLIRLPQEVATLPLWQYLYTEL